MRYFGSETSKSCGLAPPPAQAKGKIERRAASLSVNHDHAIDLDGRNY